MYVVYYMKSIRPVHMEGIFWLSASESATYYNVYKFLGKEGRAKGVLQLLSSNIVLFLHASLKN